METWFKQSLLPHAGHMVNASAGILTRFVVRHMIRSSLDFLVTFGLLDFAALICNRGDKRANFRVCENFLLSREYVTEDQRRGGM